MPDLTPFLVTGLALGSVYALAGMGLVVLFRATGELNFALGAIGAASAMAAWQAHAWGTPIALAALCGVAAATAISAGYGAFVSARVARRSNVIKAVATLGLALALLGLMYFIWGDTPRRLRLPLSALNTELFGVRVTGVRVVALVLCVMTAIGISLLLARTRLGLQMRALADGRDLSALIGIDVERVTLIAWTATGVLAGTIGILLGSLVRLEPGVLTFMVVPSIAAAILGQLRSLWLTLAGGLAIGVLEAIATPFQDVAPYRSLVPFIVAIAVLVLAAGAHLSDNEGKLMAMSETSRTPLPHAAPRGFLAAAASQHGGLITAFFLMALIVPFLGSYWIKNFTSMIAVAIAAQGVALLHARLGFVSLAGIAMMGVGGWFGLRLAHATGLPFEIVLVLAALCTGAAGVLLGLPALKHRGLIYALITLMFAAGFHVVVSSIGFPDGGSGFWGRIDGSAERQLMARPAIAASDLAYFLYALAIAAAAFTATHIVTKSAVGRAWAMIRAGDAVAHAAGVRIGIARAKAFGLAGALAGVGGCLLAGSIGQLDGRSFDPVQSLLLYGLVIIAGPWSLAAALIAGFLYRMFPAILDSWGVDGDIAITIFGLALIHAIVSAPRGIAGQLHDLTSAIQNRFSGVDR